MAEAKSNEEDAKSTEEDGQFFDAFDEFPFFDCPETLDSSDAPPPPSPPPQSTFSPSSPETTPSSAGLRRRRSLALRERNKKFLHDLQDIQSGSGTSNSALTELKPDSVVDSHNVDEEEKENESSSATAASPVRENDDGMSGGGSSLMFSVAELLFKAIGFQFNLLISFITLPFWGFYYTCMLAVNPFHVLKLGRSYLIGKLMRLWNNVSDAVSPFASEWLKEHKSWLKLVLRCGWGLLWSIYVCSVLVTLLISAFVMSGLMMRYYLVEEPFQLKQPLNFDYTKSKPVALVPITSCPSAECEEKNAFGSVGGMRVIPPNHKLQASVNLILPESDYNRNLGMFQVRVEFLSENGKSLGSLSHPCMLEFRSEPIRLLLTMFKVIPLVAGYVSEAQTLSLNFRGYREAAIPTACLKVTIEQRAEFRPGAGIPEVYDAFLHLESELPFFKRILWYWRKTIFVWLAMTLFVAELLFGLVCCRPVIIPRTRTRTAAAGSSVPQTNQRGQR